MYGPHGIARLAAGLAAMALILPAPASAQEGGPLLKSELVRMMTASNYTATEMAAIVRMNCVGFEPTDRDRSQLSNLPNADIVLAEVDRCMSRPGADEPEPVEKRVVRAPPRPRSEISLASVDLAATGPDLPGLAVPGASARSAGSAGDRIGARTTPPELTNWREVSSAFLRAYRPAVRTPGTVLLWLRINPEGRVEEARVKSATGDPAMADAAMMITDVMEFKPAMLEDQPVEGWTELPINFSAD